MFAGRREAFSSERNEFATKNMNNPEQEQEAFSLNETIEMAIILIIIIAAIALAPQSGVKRPITHPHYIEEAALERRLHIPRKRTSASDVRPNRESLNEDPISRR